MGVWFHCVCVHNQSDFSFFLVFSILVFECNLVFFWSRCSPNLPQVLYSFLFLFLLPGGGEAGSTLFTATNVVIGHRTLHLTQAVIATPHLSYIELDVNGFMP